MKKVYEKNGFDREYDRFQVLILKQGSAKTCYAITINIPQ